MQKVLTTSTKTASSGNSHEPCHIKEILEEILRRNLLFKDYFPNTELGIDLKLFTREPGRLVLGNGMAGIIVHDGEYHYSFIETAPEAEDAESPDAAEPASADGTEPDATTPAEPAAAERVTPGATEHITPEAFDTKGTRVKRNPIVIPGNCVNLHRRDDGTYYLAFRFPVLTEHYTWKNFCIEAAQEILSLTSLGEDGSLKA